MGNKLNVKGSRKPIDIAYDRCPQGAKNAALPVLCATLVFNNKSIIENVPDISDVKVLLRLFKRINLDFSYVKHTFIKYPSRLKKIDFPKSFYKSRGGFYLIASLIKQWGTLKIRGYEIGGCKIGNRPYTHFLRVLKNFGYAVDIKGGDLVIRRSAQYRGKIIQLNDLGIVASGMALILASQFEAKTTLVKFGKAPELNDLIKLIKEKEIFIKKRGRTLVIRGCDRNNHQSSLHPFKLQDDRMVIATYAVLSLITGGTFTITTEKLKYLSSFLGLLKKINASVKSHRGVTCIARNGDLRPVKVKVADYPGIPTDIQPIITVLLAGAKGVSIIEDKIFPNRIAHISELKKVGTDIEHREGIIVIRGGKRFIANSVRAKDLRSCAALLLASCIAKGTTTVSSWDQIYRGYEYLISIIRSNRALNI